MNMPVLFCLAMISKLLGAIWRHLPVVVRRNAGGMTQSRFTVTVGGVLVDEADRILLLDHVFRARAGWGIPGGFLMKGENPEDALRRELREEVAIEISNVKLIFTRTLGRPKQVEIYFRAGVIGDPKPSSFEIKRAQWFALDQLPPDLSNDQRRLIERAMSLDEKS